MCEEKTFAPPSLVVLSSPLAWSGASSVLSISNATHLSLSRWCGADYGGLLVHLRCHHILRRPLYSLFSCLFHHLSSLLNILTDDRQWWEMAAWAGLSAASLSVSAIHRQRRCHPRRHGFDRRCCRVDYGGLLVHLHCCPHCHLLCPARQGDTAATGRGRWSSARPSHASFLCDLPHKTMTMGKKKKMKMGGAASTRGSCLTSWSW